MTLGQEWRIVARDPAVRRATLLLFALGALCLWNGGRFAADRRAQAQAEVQRALDKRVTDKESPPGRCQRTLGGRVSRLARNGTPLAEPGHSQC